MRTNNRACLDRENTRNQLLAITLGVPVTACVAALHAGIGTPAAGSGVLAPAMVVLFGGWLAWAFGTKPGRASTAAASTVIAGATVTAWSLVRLSGLLP
ncbi:MAG: hypothetical protein OXG35_21435 [Acidobacteria bacterium]|nr:hypothetical protein [Acidobacteriota bacterium]